MARIALSVGDCFVIPLPDDRFAYGQYVYHASGSVGYGCLLQVFDLITDEVVPVERLKTAGPLFPPVFAGLKVPVKNGRWRKIGTLPVTNFIFPKFKYTYGTKPGKYHDWSIWDGAKYTDVGNLKPEYHSLELLCIWGDELLEERIATGVNPFAGLK